MIKGFNGSSLHHYRRSYYHHHQQGTLDVLIVTRTKIAIVQLPEVETGWPVEHDQDGNDVDNR